MPYAPVMQNRGERALRELDWNLLLTFTAIVEEGSITRAAERLFLRQPTVSNALKRLENQFGVTLMDRRQSGLVLTETGREVYEEARAIREQLQALGERLQGLGQAVSGRVAIASASHVVFPPLDSFLSRFHTDYPQVRIDIDVMYSSHVVRAVSERRATLGICLVHQKSPQLAYRHLYREHFGFFCGPDHRLFGKRGLTLADLREETFVSFQTDRLTDALRPVAQLRVEANLNGPIVGVSSHLEEVRRMIVAGLGIGPLPVHVVEPDVRAGRLWQLPPYEAPPAIDIYIVTNPRLRLSRAERVFIQELNAAVAALTPDETLMAAAIEM
jgi:DNA-binding transcriptional LysR family regulator